MWGLLSGNPLSDGNGGYAGALAMITDITDRKRADGEVTRLAAIVESSPDAIFSVDLDARITTWNAAAARLWGWSRDEAIGKSAWMLVPPERTAEFEERVPRVLAGGVDEGFRTTTRHKDGSLVEIEPTSGKYATRIEVHDMCGALEASGVGFDGALATWEAICRLEQSLREQVFRISGAAAAVP
jgi:PAS domain S-box-containing protein